MEEKERKEKKRKETKEKEKKRKEKQGQQLALMKFLVEKDPQHTTWILNYIERK